jgi:drug/metabolite transporter (DMT)-like permease
MRSLVAQVTGHAKTILVLVGSWLYLQERMHRKEVTGMAFAIVGMVAYGYFASQKQQKVATNGAAHGGGGGKVVGLAALVDTAGQAARDTLPLLVHGSSRSPGSLKGRVPSPVLR